MYFVCQTLHLILIFRLEITIMNTQHIRKTSNNFCTEKLFLNVEVSNIEIQIITRFGTAKSLNSYLNPPTPQIF